MAALTQQDDKLQYPIYSVLGKEVWKVKEASQPEEDVPTMGDAKTRAITMEVVTATAVLLAGADVVVLRHPESVKLVRELMAELPAKAPEA